MVVTSINGQDMYLPYSVFQQQMAIGGYGALNDYYYSNPSYFHPYSASSFLTGYVLASALSGTYGGYYNRYHINNYRNYRYQHTPYYRTSAYRQSRLGTSGQRQTRYDRPAPRYDNRAGNSGGMRGNGNTYRDPNAGRAGGMRSANTGYQPRQQQNTYRQSGNTGGGMRAGGNSGGGMRSGGGTRSSGGGMRSGKR